MFGRLVYQTARILIIVFCKLFYGFIVEGRENLPETGGFIIASNHSSNLDPLLLGAACVRQINFMAKEDLFRNGLFGRVLSLVGAFPIKRNNADIAAVKEAIKRLKTGCGLAIFPQGTRRQTEALDAQPGIGMLAYRAQVPVVPALIAGSHRALPAGARFLRRSRIKVILGKPLYFGNERSYPQIAHNVMRSISDLASKV